MIKLLAFIIAASLCASCSGNPLMRKPLDRASFETAKAKCGMTEASYFSGGFGFALSPGQNSPTPEQQRKLDCMDRELAGFNYHVVTETPPPE
jgi:hypothetical protein